jgi:hypothetical protein
MNGDGILQFGEINRAAPASRDRAGVVRQTNGDGDVMAEGKIRVADHDGHTLIVTNIQGNFVNDVEVTVDGHIYGVATSSRVINYTAGIEIIEPSTGKDLKKHQEQALAWAIERDMKGGGILACEPGLGKTRVLLALCATCAKADPEAEKCTLVVAPTLRVARQWQTEADIFTGLNARLYKGKEDPVEARQSLQQEDGRPFVVIATRRQVAAEYWAFKSHGMTRRSGPQPDRKDPLGR